jgi:hypothetical protein
VRHCRYSHCRAQRKDLNHVRCSLASLLCSSTRMSSRAACVGHRQEGLGYVWRKPRGAPCTQRSVDLGEPGRHKDPPANRDGPAAQRLWSGCSDRTWCLFSGEASVQYTPPTLVKSACSLRLDFLLRDDGCWRQGPPTDASLVNGIVVGTAAYLLWRSSAKYRLRLPESLLRTDHTAFH